MAICSIENPDWNLFTGLDNFHKGHLVIFSYCTELQHEAMHVIPGLSIVMEAMLGPLTHLTSLQKTSGMKVANMSGMKFELLSSMKKSASTQLKLNCLAAKTWMKMTSIRTLAI